MRLRRSPAWYARELLTLAALSAFTWFVATVADRIQPGAFPQ